MIPILLSLALNLFYLPGAQAKVATLFIVGDSLTEGYGVEKNSAFPALVEKKLGGAWKIVNSGISGSTSASGPARIKWILRSKPDAILIALGANDGLRGLPPEKMQENLDKSVRLAQDAGVKVLLAGMLAPPNMGAAYTKKFSAAFADVAKKHKVPLLPFLLDGVAGNARLNLNDGIHPNESGHEIIALKVTQFFAKTIGKPDARKK